MRAAKEAVAAGSLSSRDVYSLGQAEEGGSDAGSEGFPTPSAAIDEAEIEIEGLETAVAALERLTQLLAFNCSEEVTQGLKVLSSEPCVATLYPDRVLVHYRAAKFT